MAITAGVAAAGSAVAGVAGSAMSASAAKSAGNAQAAASQHAADLQAQQYQQTRSDLLPYQGLGGAAIGQLGNNLGMYGDVQPGLLQGLAFSNPNAPQAMTEDQLVQTPGYQFTRDQGLAAVQNSATARGLGLSGAALKGAASYATGLADQTWQNQFNAQQALFGDQQQRFSNNATVLNALNTNVQNSYSRLSGLAGLGENAAAQTGATGAGLAQSQGQAIQAGAGAQAGAQIAGANAFQGGLNSVANAGNNYLLYSKLLGNSGVQGNGANLENDMARLGYTGPANY